MLILVVEDDPVTRLWLTDTISGAGHDVYAAVTGGEALESISKMRFDAIVLDMVMPGLTGVNFIDRAGANMPKKLVVFTALPGDSGILIKLPSGAVVLTKPVAAEKVLEALGD